MDWAIGFVFLIILTIGLFFLRRISDKCRIVLWGIFCALDIFLFLLLWKLWKINLLLLYVCLFSVWLGVKYPKSKVYRDDSIVPVWQLACFFIEYIMLFILLMEWKMIYVS